MGAKIREASDSRQAAMTNEETLSAWAKRMKIEAVDAARIPMVMAKVGEMGGCFWESGKRLSRFRDMPENFTRQPTLRNWTKMTAVGAVGMRSNDKDFPGMRIGVFDMFDHCTVNRVFKNHDITRLKRTKDNGYGSGDQIIAMIVLRFEAAASNFDEFDHDWLERKFRIEHVDHRLNYTQTLK
jgi:hypothetical protein